MHSSHVDLFKSAIRLYEGGNVSAEPHRMMGKLDGWTMAVFHVETDEDVHADMWEMHPEAEEAVCVLAGGARIILRSSDQADEQIVNLDAGSAFIVPRGQWHRLELNQPSDLMSITMRNGTRLEKRA